MERGKDPLAAISNEWKDKAPTAREEADAQSFENDLFHIYGVERSRGIFEQTVRLNDGALPPAEIPACIRICDFNRFHYYDLADNARRYEFSLAEPCDRVELFSDLAGCKDVEYRKQDAVNVEAAERMSRVHDALKAIGLRGPPAGGLPRAPPLLPLR